MQKARGIMASSSTGIASSSSSPNNDNDWTPLYLSTIAGLSTCIGAAIVFCQPTQRNDNNNKSIKIVPPHTMAFSLALAGSVMVTVSVVSILPEVIFIQDGDDTAKNHEKSKMIEILSWTMLCRVLFFGVGCLLYFGLSSILHVPEPEEVLDSVLLGGVIDHISIRNTDECNLYNHTHESQQDDNHFPNELCDCETASNSTCTETEMVALMSNDAIHSSSIDGRDSDSPLRIRKLPSNIDNNKEPKMKTSQSPGDNNGKKKSNTSSQAFGDNPCRRSSLRTPVDNTNTDKSFKLAAWTTGADLESNEQKKAWRVALLLFISLLVHNFPEGLAVAASALESRKLGVTVTVGIMIHNIPEGIAIAIPCLAARPDHPWLSFLLASISGLAEPLGACIALLFLRDINTNKERNILNLPNILSFVAGIMVMVALWELFPEAKRHASQTKKYFGLGIVLGVIIMVLTEWYLP